MRNVFQNTYLVTGELELFQRVQLAQPLWCWSLWPSSPPKIPRFSLSQKKKMAHNSEALATPLVLCTPSHASLHFAIFCACASTTLLVLHSLCMWEEDCFSFKHPLAHPFSSLFSMFFCCHIMLAPMPVLNYSANCSSQINLIQYWVLGLAQYYRLQLARVTIPNTFPLPYPPRGHGCMLILRCPILHEVTGVC